MCLFRRPVAKYLSASAAWELWTIAPLASANSPPSGTVRHHTGAVSVSFRTFLTVVAGFAVVAAIVGFRNLAAFAVVDD